MVQCDECLEWFHYMCIGLSAQDVKNLGPQYVCGWCSAVECAQVSDGKRVRVWNGETVTGPKRSKLNLVRDPSDSPKEKGRAKKRIEEDWKGFETWEDVTSFCSEESKKVEEAVKRGKKKARELMTNPSHHAGDTRGPGGGLVPADATLENAFYLVEDN